MITFIGMESRLQTSKYIQFSKDMGRSIVLSSGKQQDQHVTTTAPPLLLLYRVCTQPTIFRHSSEADVPERIYFVNRTNSSRAREMPQ